MEKDKTRFKQGKRKTQNGGVNFGGLLLLGGALAVGSLVATLAAREGHKRKNSEDNDNSCKQKEDQQSPGLQTSSPTFHDNQRCASNGSTETVAAQLEASQLEENPSSADNSSHKNPEIDDQEIPLPHDLKQDSIEMRDSHCLAEEYHLPELNILSLDERDKNDVATTEFAREDAIDAVKMGAEEITSVKPAKEDINDKEEKKQAKESSFLLEENIEQEPTIVKRGAEKEDEGKNSGKESTLKKIIDVQQQAALDKVEEEIAIDAVKKNKEDISSVDSTDEEDEIEEESGQAKEKLVLEEKIKADEEEPVSVEACAEDDGDDDLKRGLPLKKITEAKQEIVDEDAERMCVEENISSKFTEEEAEKKHSIDQQEYHNNKDERILNKSKEKTGGTESSAADEIGPAGSVEAINAQLKTAEQDENNRTEDFNHFDAINSGTDINHTKIDSTFNRKEGNLKFAVWNKQTAIHSRKWKISIEHMLIMASILLLFITYCNARLILSSLY